MKRSFLCLTVAVLTVFGTAAQQDYPTNSEIDSRLQRISSSGKANLRSLVKTEGGRDIWALQLGTGDMDNKPGIAITGGVEGYHLLSVELALQLAERLMKNHQETLEKTTFYIFPNMSPDAYSQYHSSPKYERRGNAVNVDHDRDGRKSEDGFEDLNKDGFITKIRVESPAGEYTLHQERQDILVKADKNRESGKNYYKVFNEGTDNDKDEAFNEDPDEGIAFNKNLTYQFPAFEALAGDYPVSQKETRALLDYLFERWNIFAFVTFSPANNLSAPLKYNKAEASKRIATSMLEKDVEVNKMISDIYNETTSLKAYNQDNQGSPGDFFQWAYFHFGRLSFSTPGWWVPEVKQETSDTTKTKKIKVTPESNFLTWAEKEGLENVFVSWTAIDHPDFPNQKVEVGGIKPYVMENPPYSMVEKIAGEHTDFVVKLANMQPNLEFHNVRTEKLNGGLTRITADLLNNSPLPTHSELGERSRWLQKIQLTVNRDRKELISGEPVKLLDKIGAFESRSFSWIVSGGGSLVLKAGAPHTGYATMNVKL